MVNERRDPVLRGMGPYLMLLAVTVGIAWYLDHQADTDREDRQTQELRDAAQERQQREESVASRVIVCAALNEAIGRDERGVRGLIAASALNAEQKSPEEAAEDAEALEFYLKEQGFIPPNIDGHIPRIDCDDFALHPEKYLDEFEKRTESPRSVARRIVNT